MHGPCQRRRPETGQAAAPLTNLHARHGPYCVRRRQLLVRSWAAGSTLPSGALNKDPHAARIGRCVHGIIATEVGGRDRNEDVAAGDPLRFWQTVLVPPVLPMVLWR
jgi:hypothetical protein